MKILCTADIHIGRRSSRLPPGTDPRGHSCAEAWTRIADLAVVQKVDLVVCAGDVVDGANRFFEAFGPFERGVRRLREHGIQLLVVAGNHDHSILPLLVDEVGWEGARLLGRGGKWERRTLEIRGERLHVDGWSFPREHHPASPLAEYRPPAADGSPVLVLLHADLDQPGSPYAPVALAEMRRHPSPFFVLGHVHLTKSIREPGGARLLYPGSPQAMDPGETGSHGVRILEIAGRGIEEVPLSVSTVRYEPLTVSVEGAARPEELDSRVVAAVREAMQRVAGGDAEVRLVLFRVRVVGATPLHLDARWSERVGELRLDHGSARGSVESLIIETRLPRDLEEIAMSGGAPSVLASLLGQLEGGLEADGQGLLAEALRAAREMESATPYLPVLEAEAGWGEERVRAELRQAASTLLDELLAQKEVAL